MRPIPLSPQQQSAVDLDGNVLVTACPGSGKTRVLTAKVLKFAGLLSSRWQKIAAVTYTGRAADEISSRLREHGYVGNQIWTGTVHAFALEWILRPYSCYHDDLRCGFAIADEFHLKKSVDALKAKYHLAPFADICTAVDREGSLLATDHNVRCLVTEYRLQLKSQSLIDFDLVLYYSYVLISTFPEIAKTLSKTFRLMCVDEYQDTQDLQYAILSSIVKEGNGSTELFIVGDRNQAIYTSLGSVAMTSNDIRSEFGLSQLHCVKLSGNYRSTQRIVDFCSNFSDGGSSVRSMTKHSADAGIISFSNQAVHSSNLASEIAAIVNYHLIAGVKESEICILGPTWEFIVGLGRRLSVLLPDVSIDAPGLSPIKYQNDSAWFKLARLFLTEPAPSRYSARMRWASDFANTLDVNLGGGLDATMRLPRNILRTCNAIQSNQIDGIEFLKDVFTQFADAIGISNRTHPLFFASRDQFLEGAKARIENSDSIPSDVVSMKRMFQYPSGIVVNSCHGAKGEEFEVVICFGILKGRIPHWSRIFDQSVDESIEAKRMLYVICSRAKKCLHLFSESGRKLRSGVPYESTYQLSSVQFPYDDTKSII